MVGYEYAQYHEYTNSCSSDGTKLNPRSFDNRYSRLDNLFWVQETKREGNIGDVSGYVTSYSNLYPRLKPKDI